MDTSHTASSAWKHGALGGLIAGVVFALAAMLGAVWLGGEFFGPLRMIASVPLQTDPVGISLTEALLAGTAFHVVASVAFGVLAAFLVRSMGLLHSYAGVIFSMTLFGFALWLVNFYVFAPILNVEWFATRTTPLSQFVYHTFFFGTVLGLYIASAWAHAPSAHRARTLHAHA